MKNHTNTTMPAVLRHSAFPSQRQHLAGPVLGYTQNGCRVINRPNSHHHVPRELLREALARINLQAVGFAQCLVDFGRFVGLSTCVRTDDRDTIVYAQRERRRGLTRFVKHRRPLSCSTIMVILKQTADPNTWVLITAFIGGHAEPEPWDMKATSLSHDFWASHALIWGSEPVLAGSETTTCPWHAPQQPSNVRTAM